MKNSTLQRSLDKLTASIKEKTESNVIHLPSWSETKRGAPNSLIRSALFSAIQGKDRRYMEEEILYVQKGIMIKFTGNQLNQEDLTLWETLVHLARQHPLGSECVFTAHSILKELGLPTGGKNHKVLHRGIIRLTACAVEITHEGKLFFDSMIEGGVKDEVTHSYKIKLNRDLIRLFGDTQWTAIDWQQRLALRRKPLAQFLHGYYSSHREPYPVKIETLRQLSGSRNKQAASFKRQIKAAHDDLKGVEFLIDYEIAGKIVEVQRIPAFFYG